MKTITLQGTEEEFNNLYQGVFNEDKIPQEVEIRVYVLESDFENSENRLADEEFISLVESIGRVYTLQGFQDAFNSEEINSSIDVIRFISVPLF